jgi:PAS domain S-box-containing protein
MGAARRAHMKRTALRVKRVLALAIVLGFGPSLFALDPARALSQYTRDTWFVKDGLPDGEISSIIQTDDGHLWVGSQTGVARFDGVRFTVFNMLNTADFPSNKVLTLATTPDGAMWIGVPGGVVRYQQGRFRMLGEKEGLRHPYLRSIVSLGAGEILLSTGGSGIWRFSGEKFYPLRQFQGRALPAFVERIARSNDGTIWGATGEGLVCIRTESTQVYTIADGLPSNTVNTVFIDRVGRVWVGAREGLARFDGARFRTYGRRDGLSHADVRAICDDRNGNLWIGTREGLDRLTGDQIISLPKGDYLSSRVVSALFEDRDGSLWVGSGEVLSRLREGMFTPYGKEEGLEDEDVYSVLPSRDGSIWLITSTGACRRLINGEFKEVLPAGSLPGVIPTIAETADGVIWLSGKALFSVRDGRIRKRVHGGGEITALCPDGDGVLFAERQPDDAFKLFRFSEFGFQPIFPDVSFPFIHLHSVVRDREGRIWVGTEGGGLFCVSKEGVRRFLEKDRSIPHNTVYWLALDERGDLWVTTRRGLSRISRDRFFTFGAAQGMPVDAFFRGAVDGRGFLWLSSDLGLLRASLADLRRIADSGSGSVRPELFGTAAGLRSVTMSWRPSSVMAAPDGRVWVATGRGVLVADSQKRAASAYRPEVYVERVLVDGREIDIRGPIRLGPGISRVEFLYTGLDLLEPRQTRFKYRLDGVSESWVDAGTSRSAQYTQLGPGPYAFRVEATGSSGLTSAKAAVLPFEVLPVWYQTLGARLGVMFLVFAGILGIHGLRVRSLKQNEIRLASRVEERTRELQSEVAQHQVTESKLQREVAERGRAEDEVRTLNAELEARVAERTLELADANRAIQAEKERLTVTLKSIGDGVIATDVAGRVTLMNRVAEELTGRSAAEATGLPLEEVFRLLDRRSRAAVAGPARQALDFGRSVNISESALLLRRDGREFRIIDSAAPILARDGTIVGAVLVFRDVTERERMETQIHNTQRLESLAVLAGGIAHDFNNLLTGVFGFVDLARQESGGGARDSLDNALSVLEKARGLTRQLLTFTKAGEPVTTSLSLRGLLEEAVRFTLSGSSVNCKLEIAPDLWPCRGDPTQLNQVFGNLLLNARQSMSDNGTVTVIASNVQLPVDGPAPLPPGRYLRVSVRDTGAGIPMSIQSRVFEPFFSTKPSGSGLGLATSYSIIKRHGGHIELESQPGKGSVFRLFLPAADRAPEPGENVREDRPAGKGRILVMDDEDYVRKLVETSLRRLGYEVDSAPNGEKALESYRAAQDAGRRYDLVILDLTVPGSLGGIATLERLWEMDPEVRAIASSGYSSDPVMSNPQQFGFVGALGKPYSLKELRAMLAQILANEPPAE